MSQSPIPSRLIKIGNSQGIRIPKIALEQSSIGEELELLVQKNKIIIQSAPKPRGDWESQFKKMAAAGDDVLLDSEIMANDFDVEEWEW